MRAARAVGAIVVGALVAAGCTGTQTEALPTLIVVARTTTPPTLALVAVDLTPTSRGLRLVAPEAFTFDEGTSLVALDATPRDGVPTTAWVLVDDGAGANAALQRFDLGSLEDDPATTVPPAGAPFQLTDGDRGWVPALASGAYEGPVCPRQVVVGGPAADRDRYAALWDLCDGEDPTSDGRVHVVDLEDGTVDTWSEPFRYDPVGIRAGVADPATFTTVRDVIGEGRQLQTRRFDAPVEPIGDVPTVAEGDELLDLAVAGGRWWVLVDPATGDPEIRGVAAETEPTTRAAPADAVRLVVGGGPGAIAFGANAAQVVFPDAASTPTSITAVGVGSPPGAVGATIEANDYAVVATPAGTLCALDVRVPATSPGCEFVLPSPGLPEARFLTWTYAAPSVP